jgi:Ca2+-binding EF-hand superfamily protein
MADQTEDGMIAYSEFVMTAIDRSKFLQLEKMESIFAELDVDHSNTLSFIELDEVLTGFRPEDRD